MDWSRLSELSFIQKLMVLREALVYQNRRECSIVIARQIVALEIVIDRFSQPLWVWQAA